jgi:hypothetical protein
MFWGPLTQAERRTPITAGRIFFTKNSFMFLLYYSGSVKYKNLAGYIPCGAAPPATRGFLPKLCYRGQMKGYWSPL